MSHYHEQRLNDYCHVSSQTATHCDERKKIMTKAKTKNDGVYKFRGVAYRVINNNG